MSINIYWACLEDQWMLATPPETVSEHFYKNRTFNKSEPSSLINFCPAFNANLKNLFTLKSIYNYNFKIEEKNVVTTLYDQHFFDDHVVVRSLDNRFFAFRHKYIFFTDEPSLNVTFYEYPFLEDNNITKRCIIPAGTFDIGRWFRNTEFSFFLKKDYDEFIIEKDEIYSYMRVHTDKNINFIQFRYTDLLLKYNNDGHNLTKNPLYSLQNYYKAFKNKKLILKEIHNNLL